MTKRTHGWQKLAKLPLLAAISAVVSGPANAFQFYVGDIEASIDTLLTAGASWRVAERDTNQLGQGNLGVPQYGTVGSSTNNIDDGNWNFEKGDTYSKIVKGTTDFSFNYDSFGGFLRVRYFYDFELMDEDRAVDNAGQQRVLTDETLDKAGAGVDLLDAYVYTNFDVGDTPVNMRIGKQVISWGESLFIQGGINIINPIDASAARAPGAEVKDVLLPVNVFYTSLGLTYDLTMEAFVQLDWEKTQADPCGTFFSTNDFVPDGCGPVLLAGQTPDNIVLQQGIISPRIGDRLPDDTDQFGVAFRYYSAALGDTEFGLYHIQYHSRLPNITGFTADESLTEPSEEFPIPGRPSYAVIFPERIKMYGVSFSTTTETGYSVAGEYSFKEDVPVAWNAFELITGAVLQPYSLLLQKIGNQRGLDVFDPDQRAQLAGIEASGFDLFNVSQLQFTVLKFYEQVLGASRLTMAAEVGGVFVHDLPSLSEARYGRSSTFGIGSFIPADLDGDGTADISCDGSGGTLAASNNNPAFCDNDDYTTQFSWGYRVRFLLDYNNAFAGVNLTPVLAWSHDVNGVGPDPAPQFVKGTKAVGLTLRADYLNQYQAAISYNNFFGGGRDNLLNDRDNISLSVSYSF